MSDVKSRSVASVKWAAVGHVISLVALLGRSIALARLLPVSVFGDYALASSIIATTGVLAQFGMGGAFVHRHQETVDEEHAARVHFTVNLLFTLTWAALMVVGTMIWAQGTLRLALLVLVAAATFSRVLIPTPRHILKRRIVHRRLALIQTVDAILTSLIVVAVAAQDKSIWPLLMSSIVSTFIGIGMLYFWRPVWKPRLKWSAATVKYYLSFGARNVGASGLLTLLDRLDDLWTGFYLGSTALGLYSRAYKFATYPRQVLAVPINEVVLGTYAESSEKRLRLSQAFFRSNAALIRSGFLAAGALALVAPEFISIVLTEKWLGMLDAFRLMLVFTLLDPIKVTTNHLFVAVGKPEKLVKVRLVQLLVLAAGLFLLGRPYGIVGVAVAVNLMLAAGIGLLFAQSRELVDFSVVRLFGVPLLALLVGFGLALGALALVGQPDSDWLSAIVKGAAFGAGYLAVLAALERETFRQAAALLRLAIGRRATGKLGSTAAAESMAEEGKE